MPRPAAITSSRRQTLRQPRMSPLVPTALRRRLRALLAALLAGLCLAIGASLFLGPFHKFWLAGPNDRPRLSLVVLPFENLSGDTKDDYLADGITDDLTTELSHSRRVRRCPGIRLHLQGQSPRMCGRSVSSWACAMCSRAACAGSDHARVNVQLTSSETGAHLWSDRFDEQISELAVGQEQIVTRMRISSASAWSKSKRRAAYANARPTPTRSTSSCGRARWKISLPACNGMTRGRPFMKGRWSWIHPRLPPWSALPIT